VTGQEEEGRENLVARAFEAFRDDVSAPPPLTLRGGNAIDGYDRAEPFDPALDEPDDAYIEGYGFWGLGYLDARSWRHYLPRLIAYAFRRPDDPSMVVEALVNSLRPPDRYPPRLATLTPNQESIVCEFLEQVALRNLVPGLAGDAQQALEEWWWPNPRSRPDADAIASMRAEPVTYKEVGDGGYRLSVPTTFSGSGARDIPQESRRVELWGGYLCGDVQTTVAVNVTPASVRPFDDVVRFRQELFVGDIEPREVEVKGASRACRADGEINGDSPGEPEHLALLVAESHGEIFTLTVHTWPRGDVWREVERLVGSFHVTESSRTGDPPDVV
jgi:hypothetical protein